MDKPIPEAVVTDVLIADLLPAALIFAENEEHLDHARQRAKTILLETLTAAQQQGQTVACGGCGNADPEKVCIGCLHPFAAPQPMQQGGGEVCAEDLRWCEDIAESLREAGGPTNNMQLIALNRLLRHARTAPPSAPVGVEWTDEQIIATCKAAGIQWIERDAEDYGFPGGFDITHMPEMRRLFAALAQQPAAVDEGMARWAQIAAEGTPSDWQAEQADMRRHFAAQHQEPTT